MIMREHELTELAEILNVPVLTTGRFQGHQGPAVEADEAALDRIIQASNRMKPFIRAAQQTGEFAGNAGLAAKLRKPIPAYITLNHQSLQEDRIRDWLKDVDVEFQKQRIFDPVTGEERPWIVQNFRNVPAEMADIIRRFFPKRSIELLPMRDPDTQELYQDGVIISTAFLDNNTPPAVPGQDTGILVEFAAPDNTAIVITTQHPLLMEENTMPDDTKHAESVSVAELQSLKATLTELQAKVEASEQAREEAIELARKNAEAKDQEIAQLRQKDDARDVRELLTELSAITTIDGRPYQLSKAGLDLIRPHIEQNGLVELQEGEQPRHAVTRLVQSLVELAGKDALLIQLGVEGEKSYQKQDDAPQTDEETVAELMKTHPEMTKNQAFIHVMNARYGRGAAV